MRDTKAVRRVARFEIKDSFESRLEALEAKGVYGRVAHKLALNFPLWRIDQAIHHKGAEEKRLAKSLGPQWLARCLDESRIPLKLFRRHSKPDPFSQEQRKNRASTQQGRNLIEVIKAAINRLDFWQWMFLVQEVIVSIDDDYYRRIIFQDPSRSNWFLCEQVYFIMKRRVPTGTALAEYVARVKKFAADEEA